MIKIKVLFVSVFTILSFLVGAQDKNIEITQLPMDLFDNKSLIMDIEQDEKGNIWMLSGVDGITKYDGEKTRLYSPNPQDSNAITSGRLETMIIANNGIIWIATFNSGIERFDPVSEKFTHYRHDPKVKSSLRSDIVRTMIEDKDGFIWVGTDRGLDKFDPETGEFHHVFSKDPDLEILEKVHIRTLFIDNSGVLWIGGGSPFRDEELDQGGLFKYDINKDEITSYFHTKEETSLIDNRVGAIFEDSKGVFWVGTAGDGLHTMDRDKGIFTRYRYDPAFPQKLSRPPIGDVIDYADDHITFINEDKQGYIWIGTYEGGLNRYDPVSEKVTYYGIEELGSVSMWNFFRSKDNLIWISFWDLNSQKRVVKINTSPQKFNYEELGYEVQSIIELDNGEILLGTEGGLLAMDTMGNIYQKILTSDRIFQNMGIVHLIKDKENNLWISTHEGAYYYNKSRNSVKVYRQNDNIKNSISTDRINVILPLNMSYVLIGAGGGYGLYLLNLEDESIHNYRLNDKDDNLRGINYISCLMRDSEGTIWIGTGSGIISFDLESRHFKSYGLKGPISQIIEDSNKRIWIAARQSGLMYYDRESDKILPFQDESGVLGSYYDMVNITEDLQGDLWLKTSLGVVKLNLQLETTYLMVEAIGGSLYNSHAVFSSSKGKVIFGELTGFITMDDNLDAKNNELINTPYINKFYVDKMLVQEGQNDLLPNSLSQTKTITLKNFQNSFSLEYGHVDFITHSKRHIIQYKLKNYDNYWRGGNSEYMANYVKVPYGKYIFRLRASNPNGVWTSKSIGIIIEKPWYHTWWAYLIFALLLVSLLKAIISYRSKKLKIANKILEKKVEERTAQLKASQAQLIQSEKMASLGELTAGIAHEIQNPLNFVNNFSEVSTEMMTELHEELEKGDINQAKEIGNDVLQNLEKIIHHGKRADSIVKGMLMHSRTTKGEKIPTDINALCDEFLRLSYHGLRAKDRSFNAEFEVNFDESIPKIEVVPQDIGRVLLNLFNNAFQACNENREKRIENQEPREENREWSGDRISASQRLSVSTSLSPKVTVRTKNLGDKIEISVIDNGPGIPDDIKDKIFQPFFTTKPTGQGTGLGLSLAYDIVKAHAGEIMFDTEYGSGTSFIIRLSIEKS